MMGWTHRHFRFLSGLIAPHAIHFTEMITTGALNRGHAHKHLQTHPSENRSICQLGGSDPEALHMACKKINDYAYMGINLNVGCPSPKVQQGGIGACLYKQPELVATCLEAMQAASQTPVTLKCRLGVDDLDDAETFYRFLEGCFATGIEEIQVHARKAWLKGLNPRQNRTLPELNYPRVLEAKTLFPNKRLVINGGINSIKSILQFKNQGLDGVMIGRLSINQPWALRSIDQALFSQSMYESTTYKSIDEVLKTYTHYAMNEHLNHRTPLSFLLRPLQNLFANTPAAKQWRLKLHHTERLSRQDQSQLSALQEAPAFELR